MGRNGYLYVWVSNETQGWDVFFDNFSLQYKQGPVLEENHYYPFGLSMAGYPIKLSRRNMPKISSDTMMGQNCKIKSSATAVVLKCMRRPFGVMTHNLGFFIKLIR